MVSPYVIHHNPRYWPDPERFDPDRFRPERRDARPKFAYIPFGGGPRSCIGGNFAMLEMQIIVTMVLQSFDLRLGQETPVARAGILPVRPKGGLQIGKAALRKRVWHAVM